MTISGIPSVMAAVAPARPRSTVLAQHVGRVGALAVALGIGVAVVAAPGIAFAEPGTANSSWGDNDTAEAPSDDGDGGDSQTAEGADPDVDPAADEDEDEDDDEEVDPPDDVDETELEPPGDGNDAGADGADDGTATPAPPVTVPDPPATATPPSDNSHIVGSSADPVDRGDAQTGRVNGVQSISDTTDPVVSNDEPPAAFKVADTLTTSTDTDHAAFSTTSSDFGGQALTAAPVSPTGALIGVPVRIATTFVGALLSPFLAPAGPAPASPPLLWAVLGWVQRELQRTFFNSSPVLGQPDEIDQDGAVVTGTVTGTDADGDAIAYSVAPTTALGGTVVVDQQGRFTYVAPQTWSGASPLTDTFTVKVTDRGFHVHGLWGLFFGGGHTATRDVTVILAALAPAKRASPTPGRSPRRTRPVVPPSDPTGPSRSPAAPAAARWTIRTG